jgi:hypothetical protein
MRFFRKKYNVATLTAKLVKDLPVFYTLRECPDTVLIRWGGNVVAHITVDRGKATIVYNEDCPAGIAADVALRLSNIMSVTADLNRVFSVSKQTRQEPTEELH